MEGEGGETGVSWVVVVSHSACVYHTIERGGVLVLRSHCTLRGCRGIRLEEWCGVCFDAVAR